MDLDLMDVHNQVRFVEDAVGLESNLLYIVSYKDSYVEGETCQYEEIDFNKALEIYEILKGQDGVEGLAILEYNMMSKKYKLIHEEEMA